MMQRNFPVTIILFSFVLISFAMTAQDTVHGYFTSFDQVKIYYEVSGQGRPVLLIHGFTGTCNDWKNKPLADSLLANGFKTIVVDLRGNGLSDKPDRPEAYADHAEERDLIGLMKYLGLKKYDAVGYSRGSIILASLMVLDQHCKRGVLGGMGADFTDPMWPRRIGFYNALMYDTIPGYEDFRKYIASKGLDPKVLACQQKEQPSTLKEDLARLRQKVLIVCGDEDNDNGKGTDLQRLIPGAGFVEVRGNHFTSAYTPEFAEKILFFLSQ